jgi:hypothetical protein
VVCQALGSILFSDPRWLLGVWRPPGRAPVRRFAGRASRGSAAFFALDRPLTAPAARGYIPSGTCQTSFANFTGPGKPGPFFHRQPALRYLTDISSPRRGEKAQGIGPISQDAFRRAAPSRYRADTSNQYATEGGSMARYLNCHAQKVRMRYRPDTSGGACLREPNEVSDRYLKCSPHQKGLEDIGPIP